MPIRLAVIDGHSRAQALMTAIHYGLIQYSGTAS